MKNILSSLKITAVALVCGSAPALAQDEPFIGQVTAFGTNFCPRGWANTEGQLLPISSYTALFSIVGTTFGGDGRTTFALPDLRGRRAIGTGAGPGLSNVRWGQRGGSEFFQITEATSPSHNHAVNATNEIANKNGPGTDFLAIPNLDHDLYHEGPPNKVMDPDTLTPFVGGNLSIYKTSPSLGMQWCIALTGIYPSRS